MDRVEVWRTVNEQRYSLAGLLDDLSADEWETPSLCEGWRVRDVAAHLTLAPTGPGAALVALVRGVRRPLIRVGHQAAGVGVPLA